MYIKDFIYMNCTIILLKENMFRQKECDGMASKDVMWQDMMV